MTLVKLEQVSVGYQGRTVGQGIDLLLYRQEVVCLLGANGCGKTTLLKTLLGLLPVKAGNIDINQRPIKQWTAKELAQFMAYVPQAQHGMFPFTVEEVVLMGRTAHMHWLSRPNQNDKQIVQQSLAMLGIARFKHRCYSELSGGERQLVLIARALTQQPTLLVMDEPAASLDFGNQIKVLEQIKSLKQHGIAVIMTTHHPQHAFSVADRVALMQNGQLIDQGSCQQVLQPEKLAAIYNVSVDDVRENLLMFSQHSRNHSDTEDKNDN